MKKIVKFDTYPWNLSQGEFNFYTPNNNGIIDDYHFFVNSKINECDYWVIRGSIQPNVTLVKCPKENIIFLLDEVYEEAEFPNLFLKQFAQIIGPKEVKHKNYVKHHYMFPWLFKNISYSQLVMGIGHVRKKEICIIASDATWLQGHKDRFAFINKMVGHFKDRIDVYGRGFNSFDCKYNILKDYKYSICIENSSLPNYFTEKINECYLTEVMPIYYGCTNIHEYYESNTLININIYDLENSINKIEEALMTNAWEKNLESIIRMKMLYLTTYHLPNALVAKLTNEFPKKKQWNLVFHKKFFDNFSLSLKMMKNGVFQVLVKIPVIFLAKLIQWK